MNPKPESHCVLCGFQSHGPLEKATPEELNENILKGEIVVRNDDGDGVCFVCARAVAGIEACASEWLMPDNSLSTGHRLLALAQRLYSLRKSPATPEVALFRHLVANLEKIEAAMDKEEKLASGAKVQQDRIE